jgi:hypothetical protein
MPVGRLPMPRRTRSSLRTLALSRKIAAEIPRSSMLTAEQATVYSTHCIRNEAPLGQEGPRHTLHWWRHGCRRVHKTMRRNAI